MGNLEPSQQRTSHEKPEHQKVSSNSKPPGKYKAKPCELTNAPLHTVVVRAKATSNGGGYVSVFTVAKKPRKD